MSNTTTHPIASRIATSVTLASFALAHFALAQTPGTPAAPPSTTAAPQAAAAGAPAQTGKTFSQEELEQLVAPVALYPDSLLASVLMASTYPLDVVLADRWVKANPKLKDKALEDALQKQPWEVSVKSLAVFPQVLTMMSEKIEWTQKLGDAFLAQQSDVMATAQALRAKAVAQGSLKDSKEQNVVTEKTETTTIIKIEPSNPEVVYVPTYNPTVVYGAWPYPAYPPYYYYPPGYVAGGALLGFTAGVIVGGALWGNMGWGNNDINIDIDRQNNFNRTTNTNRTFQHNAERRGAVPYKDKGVAEKYNRGASPTAQARDGYRGRTDGGQAAARTGDAGRSFDGARASGTAGAGGGGRDFGGSASAGAGRDFGASASGGGARDFSGSRSGSGGSAFSTGSRAQTSSYSSRGASSMSSSRGSMGGARGGGGGRGGGGRR
jgi:hypothetical protein